VLRYFFSITLAGLISLTSPAQDAVSIKIASPRAGERARITVEEKTTTKSVFTIQGRPMGKEEVKTKSLVYVDEILENTKNAKRATKLTRTYEKAELGTDGNSRKLPVEGKTVRIEKRGEKYTFIVEGQPVEGDILRLLQEEFDKEEGKDVRDVMFPKKPVKPGETWKIDGGEIIKAIGEKGPTFAEDKVIASGKLVKEYKKEGRQFGVIEFTFEAPITGLGQKNFTVKEGKMALKLSGDGCIDGSVATGKSTTKMSLGMSGTIMTAEIKVSVESTENRTVQAFPKK